MIIRSLVLGFCFFLCAINAGAQNRLFLFDSLVVQSDHLLTDTSPKAYKGLSTPIYTLGGFVTIAQSGPAGNFVHSVSLRSRSEETRPSSGAMPAETNRRIDRKNKASFYLKVKDELLIECKDRQTGQLVTSYLVIRKKVFPAIRVEQVTTTKKTVLARIADNNTTRIIISPRTSLTIQIDSQTRFEGADIEFTLVELNTKKTLRQLSAVGIGPLEFSANSDYELRFNYLSQPESQSILYIRSKPYWYQSIALYALVIAGLAAIAIVIIVFRLSGRLTVSRKKQQEMEQAALQLQSQLNPHFTFNALNSIQGLMNTGRIEEANDYLQEFSKLLRQTLNRSTWLFNTLDQELEMMRRYIRLEALRFEFTWEIEVAEQIDPFVIEIPTLLLQPLIENAIKHGIAGLGATGQLSIQCKKGDLRNDLVISIKDNGIWQQESETGYGLSLTRKRIQTINALNKERKIELHFLKETGTTVILTFHHWI